MKHVTLIGFLGGAMFCVASIGFATNSEDHPQKTPPGTTITMEEAIKTATAHFPGNVKEAELEEEDGKSMYEISIVNEAGVSQEIEVDGNSGTILKSEQDEHEENHSKKETEKS
ncbi:MAG: PepSY domain-containing protein [Nitrospirota bacterium]|nr:PepSY domain-containing protein [Nitrospirota bacterium]